MKAALVVVISGLLLAGCGVPVSAGPEVLSTTNVPYNLLRTPTTSPPTAAPTTTSTTTSTAPPTTTAKASPTPSPESSQLAGEVAFVVDPDRVVLQQRAVPLGSPRQVAEELLAQLQAGPTETEHRHGLGSAIPSGIGLTATSIIGDLVMINVTDDAGVLAPDRLRVAVAQIVLTATSQAGVTQVLLSRNGAPVDAPLANGSLTSKPLTRRDYQSLVRH